MFLGTVGHHHRYLPLYWPHSQARIKLLLSSEGCIIAHHTSVVGPEVKRWCGTGRSVHCTMESQTWDRDEGVAPAACAH